MSKKMRARWESRIKKTGMWICTPPRGNKKHKAKRSVMARRGARKAPTRINGISMAGWACRKVKTPAAVRRHYRSS